MAFDKEGFKKSLWNLHRPDSPSYQYYPGCLEEVEVKYGWDIDGMSPEKAAEVDRFLHAIAREAYDKNDQLSNDYERRSNKRLLLDTVGRTAAAFSAYQRFKAQVREQRQPGEAQSNIVLGALQGKIYLAPDAFPPEEYPLPKPQAA